MRQFNLLLSIVCCHCSKSALDLVFADTVKSMLLKGIVMQDQKMITSRVQGTSLKVGFPIII